MMRGIIKNMMKGLASSWPVSFLVREVLTQSTNFNQAIGALQLSDLMAPTYITVAGTRPGEGTVITRSRSGTEYWPLSTIRSHSAVVQANMDHFRDDDNDGRHWAASTEPVPEAKAASSSSSASPSSTSSSSTSSSSVASASSSAVSAASAACSSTPAVREHHGWQDICNSRGRRAFMRAALALQGPAISPQDLWELLSMFPCLAHDTVYTTAMSPSFGLLCTRAKTPSEQEQLDTDAKWGALLRSGS